MRFIVTLVFIFGVIIGKAEVFPRYNMAGYASSASKHCIIMADESLEGIAWKIINKDSKIELEGVFDKNLSEKSAHTPKPFNYKIEFTKLKQEGKYKILIGDSKNFTIEIKNNPYAALVPEMVSFLKKQRSGVATPPENAISHTGDVKCRVYNRIRNVNTKWEPTKSEKYVDMMGGWYDAGDYLKFTLTTAYTTYFLLRAYESYPVGEKYKEEKALLLDEALWGLSFLMKTMPDDSTFIIQVGNADDHKQGNRMPYRDLLNGKRNAYSAFSSTQMGLTTAALALGASIFSNSSLKIKPEPYQEKAMQIYKAASKFGPPAWFEEGWEKFYADDSREDNMELAAVELYRLTKSDRYLEDAKMYAFRAPAGYWSSWANINMVSHLRLFEFAPETVKMGLEQDLKLFKGIAEQKGNVWGVPHTYTWATLYSFLGVGSASLAYSKVLEGPEEFEKMGTDVLHYTLGLNNWGAPFVISRTIPGSVKNIYSQMYKLYPGDLSPVGAIAEGPGDRKTHDELMQYFSIPPKNKFEEFNTADVVFYDNDSDFQCMETTIAGMADGIYFFTLVNKLYSK